MEIRKNLASGAAAVVSEGELAEINRLSQKPLGAGEVYTFALRLCDNEVDREFERFDEGCLRELGPLFVGRSGIFDHQWSTKGQSARVYRAEVVREEGQVTAAGDTYCWLKAYAYMLRTEGNEELIREIEGGIKKEVSVGCSVGKRVCSVCGKEQCAHVPGHMYGSQLCFLTLREARDAYEWSFVAVPAQRSAGVVRKSMRKAATLKAMVEQSGEEGLVEELRRLEQEAALGRGYLQGLRQEVTRLAALADEDLDGKIFAAIAERLEEAELLELRKVYRRRTEGPDGAQLRGRPREESGSAFMV